MKKTDHPFRRDRRVPPASALALVRGGAQQGRVLLDSDANELEAAKRSDVKDAHDRYASVS